MDRTTQLLLNDELSKKLVIVVYTLSLLLCKFINTTSYHLGRYEPSPPSTKELHALHMQVRALPIKRRKLNGPSLELVYICSFLTKAGTSL